MSLMSQQSFDLNSNSLFGNRKVFGMIPKPLMRILLLRGNIAVSAPYVVGLALLVGIFVGFTLLDMGRVANFQLLAQWRPAQTMLGQQVVWSNETAQDSIQSTQTSPEELELKRLAGIVDKTNGFYARDYSLPLGWNNMRYIIETAILHGRILNRTTIIPSFIYARACEFDVRACAAFATMVNRGDALHSDQWNMLPIEQQMGWKVPISIMFNLTHLQQSHAVITTSEYLHLHNISTEVESTDGYWDVDAYHLRNAAGVMTPNLYVTQGINYDPYSVLRVDRIPQDMRLRGGWTSERGDPIHDHPGSWTNLSTKSDIYGALMDNIPQYWWPVLNWDTVKRIVEDGKRITSTSSVEDIGDVLRENGFELVYTYDNPGYYDMAKSVVLPVYKAVPRHRIRGFYDDFHQVSARVLLMRGEFHLRRKPGALYFTSVESRAGFSRMVLYDTPPIDDFLLLAERIRDRILSLTAGRLWMAAHMRRGDFMRYNFTIEANITDHIARIKRNLNDGRKTLVSIHHETPTTYDVPDVHTDYSAATLDPPNPGDLFYLATDERDPTNVEYLHQQGAVLISDLLTQEDYRAFGWPIMLTDVLARVEQAVMSHAGFFYAQAFSSVAGGVLNLRAGLGMDPRTAVLE